MEVVTTAERFRRLFSQKAWERLQQEGLVVVDKADLEAQLNAYNSVKERNQILQKRVDELEIKRRRISTKE